MIADRTTKTLLAIIAISLVVIAAADLGVVGSGPVAPAWAAGKGKNVIVTNFQVTRSGFGDLLHVHCTNCK